MNSVRLFQYRKASCTLAGQFADIPTHGRSVKSRTGQLANCEFLRKNYTVILTLTTDAVQVQ